MTALQTRRIAEMRAGGQSYAAIANALNLPLNTVKSHCRRNKLVAAEPVETTADACKNCGNPLAHTPKKKKKKFCCDACRLSYWKNHASEIASDSATNYRCMTCDVAFHAYGKRRRKYCSVPCAVAGREKSHG
jgi:hypothetical protein